MLSLHMVKVLLEVQPRLGSVGVWLVDVCLVLLDPLIVKLLKPPLPFAMIYDDDDGQHSPNNESHSEPVSLIGNVIF